MSHAAAEVARCMLDAWSGRGARIDAEVFHLAEFQRNAAARALAILERRGGVLVADGVGLGKTFVALALAERALRNGDSVCTVVPASLRRDWASPLRRLARALELRRTIGLGLETRGRAGTLLALLTHARLSRGTHAPERLEGVRLVIVDEAHAFRTPGTRRYRALAELCRQARVALLTATPVNNSLADLYHLLRLFAAERAFTDCGVPDLSVLVRAPPAQAAHAAVRVLGACAVRRTRAQLEATYGRLELPGGLRFPRRAPPELVHYEVEPQLPARLRALEALTLAPFRLGRYGAPFAAPPAAGELLRLVLLKRLESSDAAFNTSVQRQIRYYECFIDALAAGRLLAPGEHVSLQRRDGTDVQLLLDHVVLRPLPRSTALDRLLDDAHSDLQALRALLPERAAADAKLARLLSLVRELSHERIVVFTEFRETAALLGRALEGVRRVGVVAGDGARLGRQRASRRTVIERFAPRANRAAEPPARERVDLLVSTDVLAEGLNLQDARCVISYDLPWNPVRLMQRAGRVDRLGSPHDEVRCFAFLPAAGLDEMLGLMRRLRRKLHAIGASVGLDAAVLGDAGDPTIASPMRPVPLWAAAADTCAAEEPLDAERIAAVRLPSTAASRRVLVYLEHDGVPRFVLYDVERETAALLLEPPDVLLKAVSANESAAAVPDLAAIEEGCAAATALLRAGCGQHATPSPLQLRAKRLLLRAAGTLPGGMDPETCARVDRLLRVLQRGTPAGAEAALHRAVARGTDRPVALLLTDFERALSCDLCSTAASPVEAKGNRPLVVAALEILPSQPR